MHTYIRTIIASALLTLSLWVGADDTIYPTVSPTAVFHTAEGDVVSTDTTASAPLSATFMANTENLGDFKQHYEWKFYLNSTSTAPYLERYEENTDQTDYTFNQTGQHYVTFRAIFTTATDTVEYTTDDPFHIVIPASKLEMPNAFSPNGDHINDIYGAKEGWQSLTEFHAYIFNRHGVKLYEWTDPAGGWDGTYNGRPVKQGVYFVLVKAKGSDGIEYNIKRDVNLLRGYDEEARGGATTQ